MAKRKDKKKAAPVKNKAAAKKTPAEKPAVVIPEIAVAPDPSSVPAKVRIVSSIVSEMAPDPIQVVAQYRSSTHDVYKIKPEYVGQVGAKKVCVLREERRAAATA